MAIEMESDRLTTGEKLSSEESIDSKCGLILYKIKKWMMDNLLLVLTLVGVILGFAVGFGFKAANPSPDALMWIGLPGQLYLRLLKMMIVPLIACSVVCGAAALDPKANGKISLIAFIFIISTNGLGSAIGMGSTLIFGAGKEDAREITNTVEGNMQTQDILADLIRNIIPENLFQATFAQTQTKYKVSNYTIERNTTNGTEKEIVRDVKKHLGTMGNPNIIGLIFACTLLGLAAASLKEKGKLFLDFIQSVSDTVITVVRWFMWTTPIGVISLIAVSIASVSDVEKIFSQLGMFIAAITVGILIQQLVVLSAIFFVFTRKNPYAFLFSIAKPWMIAFAATSTAVAIPEMLTACENKNKIDKRVARFTIPFSVTISCNGSALYIAGATVFVGHLAGFPLTAGDYLLIWLLVTVAAMAIPSVPSASIMTTIMILTSMNIPVEDIALLLAVEWYLDRIRSTSSVVAHTVCTAVVYSLCKKDLEAVDEKHHMPWHEDITIEVVGSQDKDGRQLNGLNGISRNSGATYNSDSSFYHSKEDAV